MIIREIVDCPKLIENFDFYNDAKDTINWLMLRGHENLAKKIRGEESKYWKMKQKRENRYD